MLKEISQLQGVRGGLRKSKSASAPVQSDGLGRDKLAEKIADGLALVARAPAQSARKVVPSTQRQNAHGWVHADAVQRLQDPGDRTVAAAGENTKLGNRLTLGEAAAGQRDLGGPRSGTGTLPQA